MSNKKLSFIPANQFGLDINQPGLDWFRDDIAEYAQYLGRKSAIADVFRLNKKRLTGEIAAARLFVSQLVDGGYIPPEQEQEEEEKKTAGLLKELRRLEEDKQKFEKGYCFFPTCFGNLSSVADVLISGTNTVPEKIEAIKTAFEVSEKSARDMVFHVVGLKKASKKSMAGYKRTKDIDGAPIEEWRVNVHWIKAPSKKAVLESLLLIGGEAFVNAHKDIVLWDYEGASKVKTFEELKKFFEENKIPE